MSAASFIGTEVEPGRKANPVREQSFSFRFREFSLRKTDRMMNLKEILLVEDSDNDVELTTEALRSIGLVNRIVVARDGAEALDYFYKRGGFADRLGGLPVVVLLDLKLPKVSGLEVLKALKSDARFSSTPVVVLTSSREERDLVDGYRLGVNAFVVKPVDFQQFMASVHQLGCFWAVVNEAPPEPVNHE
jgi:CheY-like chemotaxis protein